MQCDGSTLEQALGPGSSRPAGRLVSPTGLMAALLGLKHDLARSDEDAVDRCTVAPTWQHDRRPTHKGLDVRERLDGAAARDTVDARSYENSTNRRCSALIPCWRS